MDDSRDAAESFAKMLSVMGCEVVFFTSPPDAMAEALRLKPHIAFLDLGMPVMNGYQLARELRKHFSFDQLKIVAVTGYGQPEHRKESRRAGFDAHVLKPIDPSLVESIIRTVLPTD